MGVYYKAVCDELKQNIDPGKINNLGVKRGPIAHPEHPFGQILVFAMLNVWATRQVRIANDESDDEAYFEYEDVTGHVLEMYNKYYGTSLVLT